MQPCIWCKKSDKLKIVQRGIDTFFICNNCGTVTGFMNVINKLEAIERWNKRYGYIN